jgi:hypothetical protein
MQLVYGIGQSGRERRRDFVTSKALGVCGLSRFNLALGNHTVHQIGQHCAKEHQANKVLGGGLSVLISPNDCAGRRYAS